MGIWTYTPGMPARHGLALGSRQGPTKKTGLPGKLVVCNFALFSVDHGLLCATMARSF